MANSDERSTPATGGWSAAVAALRHRDFTLFWASAVISNTGSFMQGITVPFVIYHLTNSTTWLGISAICSLVPPVIMSPAAGPIADRYERRRVLIVTQAVQMVAAFALWGLWVAGKATVAAMLTTVIVAGLAGGINITTWQSFVPSLVPPEHLVGAVRLNSIQFNLSRALGPALAGLTLARLGAGASFMFNAVTYVLVIVALVMVNPRRNATTASNRSFFADFTAGLAYIRRRRRLMYSILTGSMSSTLILGIVQQAAAVTSRQFHTNGSGYGFLLAAQGAGTLVCSLALALHADRFARSRVTLLGLSLEVIGALGLAAASSMATGLPAFVLLGIGQVLVAVSQQTALQLQVADAFRGRVLSVYLMATMLGPPIGALALGAMADATSTRVALVSAAALMGVFIVVVITALDRLQGLDLAHDDADEPPTRTMAAEPA